MGYRPIYHNLLGYQVWFGLYITVDYSDFMQSSPGPVQACNFREANCLPLEIFSDQMCPNALPSTANLFGLMGQVGHLDYEMFVNWSSIEPNARRAAFGLWLTWKQPGILKCWWDQLLHDIFFRIYGKGMMMGFKQMIQGINAIFIFCSVISDKEWDGGKISIKWCLSPSIYLLFLFWGRHSLSCATGDLLYFLFVVLY